MFKKILFSLVPLGTVLTIGFAMVEYTLRQQHTSWDPHGTDSGPRSHRERYGLDVHTGYEQIPNKCNRDDKGYYRTSEGDSNPRTYKVLLFGDSIADQHQWAQHTSTKIQQDWNHYVETKNAGTPGFDTCSELQMFRDRALNEDFNHVLLQFCPNDLASIATIVALPNNCVRFFIGFEYVEFPRWVLTSRILTWLGFQTLNRETQTDGNRSAPEPIQHYSREFKELTEEMNTKFTVILFPSFTDNIESNDSILTVEGIELNTKEAEQRSRAMLERLNIECIEVRSFLEEHGLSLEAYHNVPNDIWHPNSLGQDIIGDALGSWFANTHSPLKP